MKKEMSQRMKGEDAGDTCGFITVLAPLYINTATKSGIYL